MDHEDQCSVGTWDPSFAKGLASTGWPKNRDTSCAAELFCHMTNFVASNFGWHKGGDLLPSPYLCIEHTKDQVDLLNPTPRDVQIGAIIDQCSGKAAKKMIAKRRVDFVTGNINSYARILNGPAQLEKIKTYNQLAASIAELQRDREERKKAARAKKGAA